MKALPKSLFCSLVSSSSPLVSWCLFIMSLDLTFIDMEDIGYEDVLQMHRGWRRSETELRATICELNTLKIKCQHLQESQARFLSQIESLESIRDLNVSLQEQMERIESEKLQLHEVNVQLIHSNSMAKVLLNDFEVSAATRDRETREARLENNITREQYREVATSRRELEIMVSNEVESRKSSEARLITCDKLINSLHLENASIRLKLDSTLLKMNQCDHELAYVSLELSKLVEEVTAIREKKSAAISSNVERGEDYSALSTDRSYATRKEGISGNKNKNRISSRSCGSSSKGNTESTGGRGRGRSRGRSRTGRSSSTFGQSNRSNSFLFTWHNTWHLSSASHNMASHHITSHRTTYPALYHPTVAVFH